MHCLALVNQKGGCGKTTTAVNLSGALARSGARVLLVDLDPQAHATLGLAIALADEPSVLEVLLGHVTPSEASQPVRGDFHLLPATHQLAEFEEVAERQIEPEQALARALASSARHFDFAILDCPPRVDGVLAANALRACDTALLVIETGAFALQGALHAIEVLRVAAAARQRAFALRAVATLFDRRLKIARELLVGMQAQLGPVLFDTAIRTSVRLREAAATGVPVQVLDPGCRAAQDFEGLAREVRAHAAELEAPELSSSAADPERSAGGARRASRSSASAY